MKNVLERIGFMWIYICTALLVGIVFGSQIMRHLYQTKTIGSLRVDRSIPDEKPYLFLEIGRGNIEQLAKEEFVVLKVKNENYLTQK